MSVSQDMREVGKLSGVSRKSVTLRKRKDMKRKANPSKDVEVVSEQKGMTAMSPQANDIVVGEVTRCICEG